MNYRTIILFFFTLTLMITAYADVPAPGVEMSQNVKDALARIAQDYGTGNVADIMRARKAAQMQSTLNSTQGAAQHMSIPLILGTYSNSSARFSVSDFHKQIFTDNPTGTMVDFYREISYDQFELSGDTYGWYKMPLASNFYTADDGLEGGGARFTLDLVMAADADIDYSQYDSDNDGYVDVVMIVHTGAGAETGANNIWSHRWSLNAARSSYPAIMPQGAYTTNDPRPGHPGQFVKINDYIIQPELGRSNGGLIDIGVFCHEFGHALGLPDLYDTDYSSSGIGRWGLMSGGSYGGDGQHSDTPVHMTAWSKAQLGWIEPQVINEGEISKDIASSTENGDQVYKLLINGQDGPEYFLIENRQKVGFDTYLPQGGLLIWHIDDNVARSWGGNTNENHKGIDLEAADGRRDLDYGRNNGDSGDPFPGATNNHLFNGSTNPNSLTYLNEDSGVALRIEDVVNGIVTVNFLFQPELLVTPTERVVAYDAGSVDFEIKNLGGGQMNWTATTSDSWLSLQNSSGSNQGILTANFAENSTREARTGFITISIENDEQIIQITQTAAGEWRAILSVTDNGGENTNLQFGQNYMATNAIDKTLGENSLQSVPDIGFFDARFILPDNSTASIFDFRATQQNYIEWRLVFQPGPAGVPFSITWDPTVLPKGSFFIRDEITGTLINQNMKESSELVIPTINIKSVKIIYSSKYPDIITINPGWNLISVPVETDNMSLKSLFPDATSNAFQFGDAGYFSTDELDVGQAYWLKFDLDVSVPLWGTSVDSAIAVSAGWNLIGPFEQTIAVSDIVSVPDGIIESDFLAFTEKYTGVEQLEPGKGYWVLSAQDGHLFLSGAANTAPQHHQQALNKVNSLETYAADALDIPITVSDATGQNRILMLGLHPQASSEINTNLMEEELPPLPPAKVFDARFVSDDLSGVSLGEGSYVDYRKGDIYSSGSVDYEIRFQSTDNSKVKIAWNLPDRVTGTITDYLAKNIINKEISGQGELSVSMVNIINRLKFSLNFAGQQELTITSPNGGETLHIGEETVVSWNSQNIQENVIIALSRDNGATFEKLTTTPNTGSFAWSVTRPAGAECLFRVSTQEGTVLDQSDASFAIEFPVGVQQDKLPTEFALEQNYPNPFNPSTTIRYQLPMATNVQLVIINSIGQIIRTLADGKTPAGSHSILWDGRDDNGEMVSSGLYFYRLKAGDFTQTRKMILMQ